MLRRTADDDDPVERVIVANADQLVVVTALADPEPRPRLIDRALVAAYDAGMRPLLCLTKSDLADPETLLSTYRPARGAVGRDPARRRPDRLRERLRGRTSVLVGHSGVGKSTLVNALVPGRRPRDRPRQRGHRPRPAHLDVRAHAGAARRARAGSSTPRASARSGWPTCSPSDLIEAFPDLDEMTEDCPRGCTHGDDEPECGLDEAVAAARPTPTGSSRSGGCSPRGASRSTRTVAGARSSLPERAGVGVTGEHDQHQHHDGEAGEQHGRASRSAPVRGLSQPVRVAITK